MLSLDKENAAMVAPRANAKQVIDTGGVPTAPMPSSTTSSLPPSSLFATPKNSNSFNNKLAMTGNTTGNTTGKRRPALCDVTLNTANRAAMMGITPNHHHQTMGITPKFDRRTTLIARALGNDYAKPVATAAAASNKRVTDCSSKVFTLAADDSELEPVERFIGSKYDSFDDLFPDGRLSELFLNNKNKITYVAKLPITDRSRLADDDVLPSICEHSESQPSPISSHLLEPMDEEEQLVELDLPPLASDDDNDYYSDDSSLSDVLHDLTL